MHSMLVRGLVALITLYQNTLSPDHGWFKARYPHGYCRFYPSCSQYAIDALKTKGIIRGIGSTIYRLLRCNPFHRGGYDPVIHSSHTL